MGKVVTIWSSTKKTGKSLFLYMLTKHLCEIMDDSQKVFIGCLNLSYGNLMNMFNINNNELNFEDIVNYKLHPDNDFSLLNSLAKRESLYFMGSRKTSASYANRNMKIFENIIGELRHTFDLCLIDAISGSENALTNMVLDKSDTVINVLKQDKEALDKYSFVTGKETAFVVNGYRKVYPEVKELESLYGIRNVFTLPDCDTLIDLKNRDKLEYYIQHETEYNTNMREIAMFMAKELKLEIKEEVVSEKKKRGLLGSLLGGLT